MDVLHHISKGVFNCLSQPSNFQPRAAENFLRLEAVGLESLIGQLETLIEVVRDSNLGD